jgi:hypothetical protein
VKLPNIDDDALDNKDAALLMTGRNQRSTGHPSELCTVKEERKLVHKLDARLVLFVALLYIIFWFVDRSNIGNARLAGLVDDF